jgi:hypothetical protein
MVTTRQGMVMLLNSATSTWTVINPAPWWEREMPLSVRRISYGVQIVFNSSLKLDNINLILAELHFIEQAYANTTLICPRK